MQAFVALCVTLDTAVRREAKAAALRAYFEQAPEADAAWAAYLLCGNALPARVHRRELRAAALEASGLPPWLFAASHETAGDFAETVALIVRGTATEDTSLSAWIEERLLPLTTVSPAECRARLAEIWSRLDRDGRRVATRLLAGTFRPGVTPEIVHASLATIADTEAAHVARRLSELAPSQARFWESLRDGSRGERAAHAPLTFAAAEALAGPPAELGAVHDWHAEWKWPGTRVQVSVERGIVRLWTRDRALATDRHAAIAQAVEQMPSGTVLDGIIVRWDHERDVPAAGGAALPHRARAKGASALASAPEVLLLFDVLRAGGEDARPWPLPERRRALARIAGTRGVVRLAPAIAGASWEAVREALDAARAHGAQGLVLKRLDAPYAAPGSWYAWDVAPHVFRAVLVYAAPGTGAFASLCVDLTFAVRDTAELVTIGSSAAGLERAAARTLDRWVRAHTVERFGPVRRVEPTQVFELAAPAVRASRRHKSGLAIEDLAVLRWARELSPSDADTLEMLRALARDAR